MEELEDFLKGDEPEVTETEPAEEIEAEAAPETEAEEPEITPEPTDNKDEQDSMSEPEKTIPMPAYMAEKQKRQEYEAKVKELEAKVQQPDFYEDPEGAIKAQTESLKTEMLNTKVNMSVELAKTVLPDFSDVVDGTWEKLTQENPYLLQQAFDADNPGLFAYQQCKNHKTLQEIGDPATFKERMKAEIMKELEEGNKKQKARDNLPESLAAEPNAKAMDLTFAGPEPLDEIVGQ